MIVFKSIGKEMIVGYKAVDDWIKLKNIIIKYYIYGSLNFVLIFNFKYYV